MWQVCLAQRMGLDCPIVPWTDVEASALRSKDCLYFLHRIGLLDADGGDAFPRIPSDWDADMVGGGRLASWTTSSISIS